MTNRIPGLLPGELPFQPVDAPAPLGDKWASGRGRALRLAYWCRECRRYELQGATTRTQHRPLACGHNVSKRQHAALVNAQMGFVAPAPLTE